MRLILLHSLFSLPPCILLPSVTERIIVGACGWGTFVPLLLWPDSNIPVDCVLLIPDNSSSVPTRVRGRRILPPPSTLGAGRRLTSGGGGGRPLAWDWEWVETSCDDWEVWAVGWCSRDWSWAYCVKFTAEWWEGCIEGAERWRLAPPESIRDKPPDDFSLSKTTSS